MTSTTQPTAAPTSAPSSSGVAIGSESLYIEGIGVIGEVQIDSASGLAGYQNAITSVVDPVAFPNVGASVSASGAVTDFRGLTYQAFTVPGGTFAGQQALAGIAPCVQANFEAGTNYAITSGVLFYGDGNAYLADPSGNVWGYAYSPGFYTGTLYEEGGVVFPTTPGVDTSPTTINLTSIFGSLQYATPYFDKNDNLYLVGVATSGSTVEIQSPNGMVKQITGLATQLSGPAGIAVANDGTIYVANKTSGNITVYAPNSSGNVAPERTITGFTNFPTSFTPMAVDSFGTLYVLYGSVVYAFPSGSSGPYAQAGTVFQTTAGTLSNPVLVVGPASQGGSFRLLPSTISMNPSETSGFTAVGTSCSDQIQVTSNNPSVVLIGPASSATARSSPSQARFFELTPVSAGTATVTVSTSSNKTATLAVTVTASSGSSSTRRAR